MTRSESWKTFRNGGLWKITGARGLEMEGVNEEWGFHTTSDIHKKWGCYPKVKRNWELPHVIILMVQTLLRRWHVTQSGYYFKGEDEATSHCSNLSFLFTLLRNRVFKLSTLLFRLTSPLLIQTSQLTQLYQNDCTRMRSCKLGRCKIPNCVQVRAFLFK